MKNIVESIKSVNEGVLRGRLSDNDKSNFKLVANAISNIVAEMSDWMESDMDYESSDTGSLAHRLSQLVDQLNGSSDKDVVFDFGE